MGHHASMDSEFPEKDDLAHIAKGQRLREMMDSMAKAQGAGATGEFPRGHIHRTDEGELRIVVTVQNNNVILAFGKPTAWIGFSRVEACELADLLKKRAQEL
jgi:hypothetical protein